MSTIKRCEVFLRCILQCSTVRPILLPLGSKCNKKCEMRACCDGPVTHTAAVCSLRNHTGYADIVLLLKKHGGNVLLKSSMGQMPGGKGSGLGSEFDIKTPFY